MQPPYLQNEVEINNWIVECLQLITGRRLKLNKINDYLLSIGSKPCQIADISSIAECRNIVSQTPLFLSLHH
ncbi:tRNA(Met) cytidine acetate ligase [Trichinella spiralis]|uniref:tRNA(Met) cytidine acetate ligase n=1 Tax=Trichinella spiralis TaxID=6334 RepID=A0ABR3KYW7_TRISP